MKKAPQSRLGENNKNQQPSAVVRGRARLTLRDDEGWARTMGSDGGAGLMSDELKAQLGGGDVLMLKKSGKKAKGGGGGEFANFGMRRPDGRARGNFVMPNDKKMSKSQRRKLAKIEEDKRKRTARASVVARLEAAKLVSDESLTLLAGSARLGHKLTAKEKLRRELKAERAGITLPGTEDSRLHKREKAPDDENDARQA